MTWLLTSSRTSSLTLSVEDDLGPAGTERNRMLMSVEPARVFVIAGIDGRAGTLVVAPDEVRAEELVVASALQASASCWRKTVEVFRWSQEKHRVDGRQVETLVKHVDGDTLWMNEHSTVDGLADRCRWRPAEHRPRSGSSKTWAMHAWSRETQNASAFDAVRSPTLSNR